MRWLCEFALHDRVLALQPAGAQCFAFRMLTMFSGAHYFYWCVARGGTCADICFVFIPAGSVFYWRFDVRHGGTSHSIWRRHPAFANVDIIHSVAVHWYCDAYSDGGEKDEKGKFVDASTADCGEVFNQLIVPRDIQGEPQCGWVASEDNLYPLAQRKTSDTIERLLDLYCAAPAPPAAGQKKRRRTKGT